MLCRGIDPRTGKAINTPHDPKVDKARLSLLDELKALEKRLSTKSGMRDTKANKGKVVDPIYPNKGKAWNAEDDTNLKHGWSLGLTLDTLTKEFGRTAGALCARLVHLGEGEDRESIRKINIHRGGDYGKDITNMDE